MALGRRPGSTGRVAGPCKHLSVVSRSELDKQTVFFNVKRNLSVVDPLMLSLAVFLRVSL
jgi:hypothetical protein